MVMYVLCNMLDHLHPLVVLALWAMDGTDSIGSAAVITMNRVMHIGGSVGQRCTTILADDFFYHRLVWSLINNLNCHDYST